MPQKPRRICVHVLYKRAEIPANTSLPAIAVSVTYRKQEKAANTGSIPVSATNFSQSYGRWVTTGDHALWPREAPWSSSHVVPAWAIQVRGDFLRHPTSFSPQLARLETRSRPAWRTPLNQMFTCSSAMQSPLLPVLHAPVQFSLNSTKRECRPPLTLFPGT